MAMKMTVTNSTGFEFPFGDYILKLTKIDPPEQQTYDGKASVRTTFYFTVVEVVDSEAENEEDVLNKELRSYVTIPENGLTPRSKLRQYTEALLGRKLIPGEDEWDDVDDLIEDLTGKLMKATWDEEWVEIAGKNVQRITAVGPYKRKRRKAADDEETQEEKPKRNKVTTPDDSEDEPPF